MHKKEKLESLLLKATKRRYNNVSCEATADDAFGVAKEDKAGHIGFTLIGIQSSSVISRVRYNLPVWLKNPINISADITTSKYLINDQIGFENILLRNILYNRITHLFPVQHEVILWMLNDFAKFGLNISDTQRPRDICVSTPTGSGKTLAYVLPLIHCLSKRVVPKIRALVVAPVQELVIQIASVFTKYCKGTNLRVMFAVGDRTNLSLERSKLVKSTDGISENSVDILVITPGRLVEHLENTKGFDLRSLRFLVLDEADRLLDNVQNDWLFQLEKHFIQKGHSNFFHKKSHVQKLLFSATLSLEPEILNKLHLFQPVLFTSLSTVPAAICSDMMEDYASLSSYTTPSEIKEHFIITENVFKPLIVTALVDKGWRHILCFTKSSADAHKLSKLLSFLHPCLNINEISSQIPSVQRKYILRDFHAGSIDLLVCSDVMARGIDADHVKFIISYDCPKFIQTYIHRVGRTGRAGEKGNALTLVTPSQTLGFDKMLKDVNKTNVKQMFLDEDKIKRRLPDYTIALQKLKAFLKKEQAEGTVKKYRKTVVKNKNISRRKI